MSQVMYHFTINNWDLRDKHIIRFEIESYEVEEKPKTFKVKRIISDNYNKSDFDRRFMYKPDSVNKKDLDTLITYAYNGNRVNYYSLEKESIYDFLKQVKSHYAKIIDSYKRGIDSYNGAVSCVDDFADKTIGDIYAKIKETVND